MNVPDKYERTRATLLGMLPLGTSQEDREAEQAILAAYRAVCKAAESHATTPTTGTTTTPTTPMPDTRTPHTTAKDPTMRFTAAASDKIDLTVLGATTGVPLKHGGAGESYEVMSFSIVPMQAAHDIPTPAEGGGASTGTKVTYVVGVRYERDCTYGYGAAPGAPLADVSHYDVRLSGIEGSTSAPDFLSTWGEPFECASPWRYGETFDAGWAVNFALHREVA